MAAIALDPKSYGLLKEIIDETYTDRIDRITEAWAYPDGSIQAFVMDEGRELSVEIGEDINIFQTGEDASFQASFAGGKPRNCSKGISCGGSCIAKNKTCRKKSSEGQKAKAKEIVAMVHVPKQVEAKSKAKSKAKSGGKKASNAKPKGGKTSQSSDDIKRAALMDESFLVEEANNPRYKRLIEQTKAHNAMIRGFGEVGDVTKMSADDLTNVLVWMDGEDRSKMLGLTKDHFNPKKSLGKDFYRDVSKKIHPDINKNPHAGDAFASLNETYGLMK